MKAAHESTIGAAAGSGAFFGSCWSRQRDGLGIEPDHMPGPIKTCDVKILLANPEPSTHGTSLPRANAAACPQRAEEDMRAPA